MSEKPKEVQLLAPKEVARIVGTTRQHKFNMEKAGQFPQRVKISENRIGYIADEIYAWVWKKAKQRERRRVRL